MARLSMKVGFTGTQSGLTSEQEYILRDELEGATEFHHGDCIGADAAAHEIALALGIPIILHPPTNSSKRAFCRYASQIRPERPYLDRNKHIVKETDRLIGCPGQDYELIHSGTWSTIRFAAKMRKPYTIITPVETRNFI